MRPKASSIQKRETIKKKNHAHYSTHKHAIATKKLQKGKLPSNQPRRLEINDIFTCLSINESTSDPNTPNLDDSASDADLEKQYFFDTDEDHVTHDSDDESAEDCEGEETNDKDLSEEQMTFGDEFLNMDDSAMPIRDYDELDISVILLLLKKKHRITNSLVVDLLKLLKVLKVPNVPSSWHKLQQIVRRSKRNSDKDQKIIDLTLYFCPECGSESNDREKCTNQSCSYNLNTLMPLHTCMIMNIKQQIEQVLRLISQNDLQLPTTRCWSSSMSMTDIQDGRVYRKVLDYLKGESRRNFITLTCNIDGISIYTTSEQSVWMFTACINEIKRTLRFSIDNIIVLAVSVGYKKPSRLIMQQILSPIVTRLQELQKPNLYQVSLSYEMLRVYLIGISNDKPANSLVQNQPEPNALYGCAKCEIAGHTTPAKIHAIPSASAKIRTTYVRIFPTPADEEPEMRCNSRWHEISHALQNGHRFFTDDNKTHSFGYLGDCELTNLSFVDRGVSFMSDSLHSIYHGAFKKLLVLWTTLPRSPWSIIKFLPMINVDLGNIHYPSTTTRVPRNILKCLKFKANEARVLLLIGYPIFKKYLPEVYFQHLQLLAFGIFIGESRNISVEKINEMEILLSAFVDYFPYPERYIVQNIHSVKHFSTTVRDYGPLFNFSTFNYESVIGCLSASIHGNKRVGTELVRNLQLFRESCYASKHHCLPSRVWPFIEYLETGRKYRYKQQQPSNESISRDDLDLLHQTIPKNNAIESVKWVALGRLTLSTKSSSHSKTFSDSCIVYKHFDEMQYGIIHKIFSVDQGKNYLLKIQPLQNINYDSLKVGDKMFFNEYVIFGTLSKHHFHLISSENVIEKACFYETIDTCYFARYPNFYESS